MGNFKDYYAELLRWEDEPDQELIQEWNQTVANSIATDFERATLSCGLKNLRVPIRRESTPQSMGNQFADFFVENIGTHLTAFQIQPCSGAGYPDKILRAIGSSQLFPLELKSSRHWDPTDSNRVVLTSSSDKLRRRFLPPINHLLITLCFRQLATDFFVSTVKLDFIEPNTTVNVRLEASVSPKILHRGGHFKRSI